MIVTAYSNAAQSWKCDPDDSRLGLKTTHMNIPEVNGVFKGFEIKMHC